MHIECPSPEATVKRAFFLAYKACGGALGMGVLQAREQVSEADVWKNVSNAGDYPGDFLACDKPGEAYGDYVFGRMMKLKLAWDENGVIVPDSQPAWDYQGWSGKGESVYASYEMLVCAAIQELANEVEPPEQDGEPPARIGESAAERQALRDAGRGEMP